MSLTIRIATILTTLTLLAAQPAAPAFAGGDWNDAGIKWRSYDDALAEAKKQKKPICLIFYTDWCPHCKNYSTVFHDPKVVAASKSFVMVHINADNEKELAKKFSGDGGYIPRTFFLASNGTLDPSIHAPRDKYMYFYDEKDPASVLAAMDAAKTKLK